MVCWSGMQTSSDYVVFKTRCHSRHCLWGECECCNTRLVCSTQLLSRPKIEQLCFTCLKSIINPLLPKKQVGFQRGNSTVDQVVLLTQNIKDSFKAKKYLSVPYLSIWQVLMTLSGTVALNASCLKLLPDKHMVRMFIELVWNWSFTLTTSESKQSKADYAI